MYFLNEYMDPLFDLESFTVLVIEKKKNAEETQKWPQGQPRSYCLDIRVN